MCPGFLSSSPFEFNQIQIGFGSADHEKEDSIMITETKQDHFSGYWKNLTPVVYESQQLQFNFFSDNINFSSNVQQSEQPIQAFSTNTNTQFGRKHNFPDPSSSMSPLDLLNNYGPGLKKPNGERMICYKTDANQKSRLSTEEIMRAAGAKFIQSSVRRGDNKFSVPMHPYGSFFSAVSDDDARDVELAVLLLAASEKVAYQQFDRGSRLLTHCEWIASAKVNTVQKIVSHFAEALRARIEKETGMAGSGGLLPKKAKMAESEIAEGLGTNLTSVACHLRTPFTQVMQFAAVQSIIESIGSSTKIHLVDLEIRSGVHWTVLMEALAERKDRPIERLTVTAVGSTGNKHKIDETGKWLMSFAESKNMPFSFKTVIVSEMEDVRREMFEIREDETVAIYAMMILRTLLWKPDCLENLMGVIKDLSPRVMSVIEVEANHNSPLFVDRFIEALFFFSAYFDCLETCMGRRDKHRAVIEAILKEGIRRVVAADGSERTTRSVKVEVWRAFFRRFKMVEIGFSESSQYQAKLVAKRFGPCTLDKNDKCLVVGWKGTPINSASAWRFI